MNRLSFITSDRRFRWCLALSIVLTTVGLSYLGLMLQPRPLPIQAVPRRMMRIAFLPPTLPHPKKIVVRHIAPKPVKKIPPRPIIVKRPMIVKPRPRKVPQVRRLKATLRRAGPRHNPVLARRPAAPGGAASHAPVLAAAVVDPALKTPTPPMQRPVMTAQNSHITIPLAPPAEVDAPTMPAPPEPDNSGGSGSAAGNGTGNGAGAGSGDGQGAGRGTGGGPFGIGSGGAGNGEGPRHVVYVLDVSGSMESRINRAEQELHKSLSDLQSGETFDIITFSDEIHLFSFSMNHASSLEVALADAYLRSLKVGGSTNLERALKDALAMRGVNVVYVITDGVPTEDIDGNEIDPDKYMRILPGKIRALNVNNARIYTIGLVGLDPDGKDMTFPATAMLSQIAKDNGGVSEVVPLGVPAD